jgi:UDP-3-O-[3-hydroxymyristoyl] glucosamine N-acyltransferase
VKTMTLGDLAKVLEGELEGDPGRVISGVAPLDTAGPEQVSFLSNPRLAPSLEVTRAGGIIVSKEVRRTGLNLIRVADPYLGFAVAMEVFYGRPHTDTGISDKASVHPEARVGDQPSIHPFAVVCEGAVIGDRVTLMPGVYIGPGAKVGDDCVIHPNVVLEWGVILGRKVIIHAGTVIGSDGYGYAREGKCHRKIIHTGIVRIEDEVEIGAACAIDRAVMGETVIGAGSKLDNLIMVAHNVRIGKNCLLTGQTGIAGSTELGDNVIMAGQSGVSGHLKIGNDVTILPKSAVVKNLPDGASVAGIPAVESGQWRKNAVVLGKLDDLRRRVIRLETLLAETRKREEEDRN